MHNGLSADALGAAVADNHRLKQLSVEDNPMPAAPLAEVSALVGSSPGLEVLTLVGCGLREQAGGSLAEAVRFSTALRLPLNTLDLQGNRSMAKPPRLGGPQLASIASVGDVSGSPAALHGQDEAADP